MRSRLVIAVLWSLSLLAVSQWSAAAQQPEAPGVSVRFLQGRSEGGIPTGTLLAYVKGQWIPVKAEPAIEGLPVIEGRQPIK